MSRAPGADLLLSFQDLAGTVGGYNVYEGALGAWYSHSGTVCQAPTAAAPGGRRQVPLTPAAGSRYYLVTSYDLCAEGSAGTDSAGTPRPAANLDCSP